MVFPFGQIAEEEFPHFKNGEGCLHAKMQFDGKNRILMGRLEPGNTIGYHKHETNSEIIYILSGAGKCLIDDGEEALAAGDCHYCPQGHSHSLINNGTEDLIFFAVVPEHGV